MCLRRIRWLTRLSAALRKTPAIETGGESNITSSSVDLPAPDLLQQQATWLAPARAQLLRRVSIARRRRSLDLGAGYGAVTPELVRRSRGPVIALDKSIAALQASPSTSRGAHRVAGDGRQLPFATETFDLVFSQLTLLWITNVVNAISEIWRILLPGGVLVALEPDYGGMMEAPQEIVTRDLWLSAMSRAGADPRIGRKLPKMLSEQGFTVHIGLFDTLYPPAQTRFRFLEELPLTDEEKTMLNAIQKRAGALSAPWDQVAHLPFFLIIAEKPTPT